MGYVSLHPALRRRWNTVRNATSKSNISVRNGFCWQPCFPSRVPLLVPFGAGAVRGVQRAHGQHTQRGRGGRDHGRPQPLLPQHQGHLLPNAPRQPGDHPRHSRIRHRHPILRASLCMVSQVLSFRIHGEKGFVIPSKSFVKIGITKIFCYSNKMFSSINKTFGCCSKIFGRSNKKVICRP